LEIDAFSFVPPETLLVVMQVITGKLNIDENELIDRTVIEA